MFVDEIVVEVYGGRGGNGMVSFRREKHVEFGGPSGGNGGGGGDVVFVGAEGMNTLAPLKFQRHIKAPNGENGKSKSMHGKNAEDIIVSVPLGTVIYTLDDRLIGEVMFHDQEIIVAKGGRGGRGNISFATNKNPAPEFAENGDQGENIKIHVELKVLADVGLIGLPNAGKSTLISVLSNAKPKIADYPFTTLNPNLGMVYNKDESFVVADLPGLIENAHQGDGLGIQFLKHIERCRVLVHILDGSSINPLSDKKIIENELLNYDEKLMSKPRILVINKIDVISKQTIKAIQKLFPNDTIYISAYAKTNIQSLLDRITFLLKENPIIPQAMKTHREYLLNEIDDVIYSVENIDGVYVVTGAQLEVLFNRTDFTREASVDRFARQLRRIGLDDKLRALGVKSGEVVRIFDYEFEFID